MNSHKIVIYNVASSLSRHAFGIVSSKIMNPTVLGTYFFFLKKTFKKL